MSGRANSSAAGQRPGDVILPNVPGQENGLAQGNAHLLANGPERDKDPALGNALSQESGHRLR